jgi:hypothetical protein
MQPRPNRGSRSHLSQDIRELGMKQSSNDEEIPDGIGEQLDSRVQETLLQDEIGREPALPREIALV